MEDVCAEKTLPSKPMTLIDQKPLISYTIDLLIGGGIEKIYIIYHSATADVLNIFDYSSDYMKYVEFIEEDEQKGTLLTFSRIKDMVSPPFLMTFADIIAKRTDFIDMLKIGSSYIVSEADLIIQTVSSPSLLSEKAFLIEGSKIIKYQKNGVEGAVSRSQSVKYGGMVCPWLKNPFPIINKYLLQQNYKLSSFLENYIPSHLVFEMPVRDMWDIDTPEVLMLTEKIYAFEQK